MAAKPPVSKLKDEIDPESELWKMFYDPSPYWTQRWIESFLTIDTETTGVVPFKLYPQQVLMLEEQTGRDVTIKGRQTRASSLILARNVRRMVTNFGLKCVAEGTLVRTEHGFLTPVEDLLPGDRVYTHKGRKATVQAVLDKGSRPVWALELPGETLVATPDHQIWTEDGWCRLDEIGERLVGCPRRQSVGRGMVHRWSQGGEHWPLTEDFGYSAGLFLAEGSLHHGVVTLYLHEKETSFVERVHGAWAPWLKSVPTVRPHGEHGIRVTFCSRRLEDFLRARFYRRGDKAIPDSVFSAPAEFLRGLVAGYLDGDGCLGEERRIGVASVRPQLLTQLQDITFGLAAAWAPLKKEPGTFRGKPSQDVWKLTFTGRDNAALRRWLGLPVPSNDHRSDKRRNGRSGAKYRWLKASAVPLEQPQRVYDVVLDHPDHSFRTVAAAPHNCIEMTQDDQTTATFRGRIKHHLNDLRSHGFEYPVDLDNDDELVLGGGLENRFLFTSGEQRVAGRAYTGHTVHLSELAHYPEAKSRKLLGDITPSVPGAPFGWFDIESTPAGADTPFEEYAMDARPLVQDSRWTVHLYPWWLEPRYIVGTEPGVDVLVAPAELKSMLADLRPSRDEKQLVEEFQLRPEQILWRRIKWKEMAKTDTPFLQEFVERIETCFLSVSENFFASPDGIDHLGYYRNLVVDPVLRREALPFGGQDVSFYGPSLSIWELPEPGDRYCGWIDCAGGGLDDRSDYTALVVLNADTRHHVATLRLKTAPEEAAPMAAAVMKFYNMGLLGGERDAYGATCLRTLEALNYENLWYYSDPGHRAEPTPWAHPTQIRDKILSAFRRVVFSHVFITRDQQLVREMGSFGWAKVQDKQKAVGKTKHDDVVLAGAGATYIAEEYGRNPRQRELARQEEVVVGPHGLVLSRRSLDQADDAAEPWMR